MSLSDSLFDFKNSPDQVPQMDYKRIAVGVISFLGVGIVSYKITKAMALTSLSMDDAEFKESGYRYVVMGISLYFAVVANVMSMKYIKL